MNLEKKIDVSMSKSQRKIDVHVARVPAIGYG